MAKVVKKPAKNDTEKYRRAADLLKQVSDPTRISVVSLLSEGEQNVGAMCNQINLPHTALSHHLTLLRSGGIIAPRRQGRNIFYGLTDTGERISRVVKAVSGSPADNQLIAI